MGTYPNPGTLRGYVWHGQLEIEDAFLQLDGRALDADLRLKSATRHVVFAPLAFRAVSAAQRGKGVSRGPRAAKWRRPWEQLDLCVCALVCNCEMVRCLKAPRALSMLVREIF